MRYPYIAWKDEGRWVVHSPSVPGVYGLGRTKSVAEKDFSVALDLMLSYLREIGERLPAPLPLTIGTVTA